MRVQLDDMRERNEVEFQARAGGNGPQAFPMTVR
jgi:hypothetical protein